MTPSHLDEWAIEGWAFAVAGWAQLGLAFLLVSRRQPWVPAAVAGVNTILFSLWVWSRAAGFPVGPHNGHAATVQPVDALVATAEVVGVGVALWLLRAGSEQLIRRSSVRRAMVAVVPLVAVVATTAALAAPSTRDHADGTHGEHPESEVAGATTSQGSAVGADGGDAAHDHPEGAPEDDATTIAESDHEEDGHGDHGEASADADDDKGWSLISNGEAHGDGHDAEPWGPMDPATAGQVAQQLAPTAELMVLYPTLADAEAAGLGRNGRFNPGLGVHYGGPPGWAIPDPVDPSVVMSPMLIYRDTSPTAPLVGFMFSATSTGVPPEGFAGDRDVWHLHERLCIELKPGGGVEVLHPDEGGAGLEANCRAMKGMFIAQTGSMVHVWNVPGWENPLGLFHEAHPAMTCADGTYYAIGPDEEGSPESTCRDAAV